MPRALPLLATISATILYLPAAHGQSKAPPDLDSAARFAPLVDYHQHLASPAGAALLNAAELTRSLPAVILPPPVQRIVSTMSEHWNDSLALRPLYTADAIILANYDDATRGWERGQAEAASYASRLFGRPYSITPVLYSQDGRTARVAGYFTRGAGMAARHFAYFLFDLVADTDGSWRIAADSRTFTPKPYYQDTISGAQLITKLDSADIQKAVVLSDAYWFDSPDYTPVGQSEETTYARVRAENDWTADQAARSNGRLIAFCSFNPLSEHALTELARCKADRRFRGIKLHLQTSGVDLTVIEHLKKVRALFAAANAARLPIVVHAQTKKNYGPRAAQIFIDNVLTAAPDIPVTVAHLWGGGPWAPDALNVYVNAVRTRNPAMRDVYFDVAEAALVANGDAERVKAVAQAIRDIGPARIVFGSDAVGASALSPVQATAQFRKDIPLTTAEFAIIAHNVMPYVR